MAHSNSESPLAEYHARHGERQKQHLDKFGHDGVLTDLTALTFPLGTMEAYPPLLETCQYLNQLYRQFKDLETRIESVSRLETSSELTAERMRKKLRRKLAPQLLLALQYVNVAITEMSEEHRDQQAVKKLSQVVYREIDKYRFYEPVAELYLVLRRRLQVNADLEVSEARNREWQLRNLIVARDKAILPLGKPVNCVPDLKREIFNGPEWMDAQCKKQKLEAAKEKIETGLEEWRMIDRFVKLIMRRQSKNKKVVDTLESIVLRLQLGSHIESIQEELLEVEEELTWWSLSAMTIT
ncbi:hypothetical protein LTS08_008146 [Lithohypha guttulata]|nr:hypothetical protein LTS08_008146 [Lithohypha guttulata]